MPTDHQIFLLDIGEYEIVRVGGELRVALNRAGSLPAPDQKPAQTPTPSPRAEQMRALLNSGLVKNRAELARHFNLSRARITQILGPIQAKERN